MRRLGCCGGLGQDCPPNSVWSPALNQCVDLTGFGQKLVQMKQTLAEAPCPPGHPMFPSTTPFCAPTFLVSQAEAHKTQNGKYPDWFMAMAADPNSAAGGSSSSTLYWVIGVAAVGAVGYFAYQALK